MLSVELEPATAVAVAVTGAVSVADTVPSTASDTFATPALEDALTITGVVPETVAPADGEVIVAVGGADCADESRNGAIPLGVPQPVGPSYPGPALQR